MNRIAYMSYILSLIPIFFDVSYWQFFAFLVEKGLTDNIVSLVKEEKQTK
jgi:hypothetical protein